jgi:hypothetical protein
MTIHVSRQSPPGVDQSTVCDQRSGLLEALRVDADVVALNLLDAGKPRGQIPVQVIDVATDDDSQQVVATTDGDHRGSLLVCGDLLGDGREMPRRRRQLQHGVDVEAETVRHQIDVERECARCLQGGDAAFHTRDIVNTCG